jgi:hypothetical protein
MTAYILHTHIIPHTVTAHPGRAAAQAAANTTQGQHVVETPQDLPWVGKTLAGIYNGITGQHTARFESNEIGRSRIMKAIEENAMQPNPEHELLADAALYATEPQPAPSPDQSVEIPPKPRRTKNAERDAHAASGVMPEKPVVTSPTNMHRQKHFDALAAYAAANEWEKIEAYAMRGVDSYCKMINQYRDRLLAAHRGQQAV